MKNQNRNFLKSSLGHLPEEKQNELKEIVSFVTEGASVDMIILFGSYARGDWVEDRYVENGTTYEYKSDYDLLFVMEDEEKAHRAKYARRLKRKISNNTGIYTAINVICHGIGYLNSEIEDCNYFFTDILKEGILLYDSQKYELSTPKRLKTAYEKRKVILKNGSKVPIAF